MTNTKQQILDAYNEVLQRLKTGEKLKDQVVPLEKKQRDFSRLEGEFEAGLNRLEKAGEEHVRALRESLSGAAAEVVSGLKASARVLQTSLETQQTLDEALAGKNVLVKKQQEREREEYEYEFTKQKERQEQELAENLTTKTKELEQREQALKEQEVEVADLRKQVGGYEASEKKAVDEAVKRVTKELEAKHEQEMAMQKQASAAREQLLTQQVGLMKAQLDGQVKEILRLQKEVTAANAQLTRIAEQAVQKAPEVRPTKEAS